MSMHLILELFWATKCSCNWMSDKDLITVKGFPYWLTSMVCDMVTFYFPHFQCTCTSIMYVNMGALRQQHRLGICPLPICRYGSISSCSVTNFPWNVHTVLLCFVVLWTHHQVCVDLCGFVPISLGVASLLLKRSYDCPGAVEVTLKDMGSKINGYQTTHARE